MKELQAIQQELKVPKGQFNKFSNFYYRSCEDILEAVKPLLKKHNLFLTISDRIVNIGERYYVKAIATIKSGDEVVKVTGYAREEKIKKGMDGSQITGSASSYARKYALNGLFLIDDGRDADSMDNRKEAETVFSKAPINRKASTAQVKYLKGLGYKGDFFKMTFEEADKQIKLLSKEQ